MGSAQLVSRGRRSRQAASPLTARVCGFHCLSVDLAAIEALRRTPGELPGLDLPASFLKHSDEQSVAAFVAVIKAIQEHGAPIEKFRGWGVVGAPRYMGRLHGGGGIVKFFDHGVRGISPHSIPQNSLHSVSGVISVGLRMGGPNLGAGGGPRALAEGMMTAFAMLSDGRLPGVWLAATEWEKEPIPQKNGRVVTEGPCHAVALMLEPAEETGEGLRLTFRAGLEPARQGANDAGAAAPWRALALAQALTKHASSPRDGVLWSLSLDWGAEVSLTHASSL